jgi:hypothetical protein
LSSVGVVLFWLLCCCLLTNSLLQRLSMLKMEGICNEDGQVFIMALSWGANQPR